MSYLFTQIITCVSKCSASSKILFKSSSPDLVGSVTISAISVSVIDAITEHPIPGEPSRITMLLFSVKRFAFFLSSVTSFPDPSLPIPIIALDMIPLSVFVIKVSAVFSSTNLIAFCGHTKVQAPHPSQLNGSIVQFFIAPNLQTSSQISHSMQRLLFIFAFLPP